MLTQTHSLVSVVDVVRRWRLPVLLATLAALVISVVVSLLLPNEYKSTAVFLPTSYANTNVERILGGDTRTDLRSSTSEDIDRIITIGQSQLLAEHIIRKFSLYNRYGIDTASNANAREDALNMFSSYFNITQNSRDAIEVTFLDKDPKLAAAVANEIVSKIDQINQELTYENRKRVVDIYQQRYRLIRESFLQMQDSMVAARTKYGIYDFGRQIKEITQQLATVQSELSSAEGELQEYAKVYPASHPKIVELKAVIAGRKKAIASLSKTGQGSMYNLEDFAKGADYSHELFGQFSDLNTRLVQAKAAYETGLIALQENVSTLYTVQKAVPPTRKAKPVRWLIVVTSTLITFLACVVLISLYEVYRKQV